MRNVRNGKARSKQQYGKANQAQVGNPKCRKAAKERERHSAKQGTAHNEIAIKLQRVSRTVRRCPNRQIESHVNDEACEKDQSGQARIDRKHVGQNKQEC